MRNLVLVASIALAAPVPAFADGAALALQGRGVQIYACRPTPDGFGWRFVAPEADLFDASEKKLGHHFAGPSWQASDGSLVVGEVVASGTAPRPGAIPWLVLRAKSHAGQGAFASTGFVVRTETDGGAVPATGCDQAHAGTEQRVTARPTSSFREPERDAARLTADLPKPGGDR